MKSGTRLAAVIVVAALVALLGASPALGNFAYVKTNEQQDGIRAALKTPSSPFGGVPIGTTAKVAVYVTNSGTNCGWLVRPGEYNNPETYYCWYSVEDGILREVPLSPQSYNQSRAYELDHVGGNGWNIKIVGQVRRGSAEPSVGSMYLYVGGKTSGWNSNLRGSVSDGQYNICVSPQYWYYLLSGTSTLDNDYPLEINVSSINYAFSIHNPLY
jgi:hypothetical protein